MIKARVRGLGAADPFASSYRNDLIGQQLSLGQQLAVRQAPQHLIPQAPKSANEDPEVGIYHSECQQVLEAAGYYGAPAEMHGAMLASCSVEGAESFIASLEAAGIDTGTSQPWYKKPVVWMIGGGVALLGVALYMRR